MGPESKPGRIFSATPTASMTPARVAKRGEAGSGRWVMERSRSASRAGTCRLSRIELRALAPSPLALFAHGRITGGCWPSYQFSPACPASSSHAALNILDRSFLLNFQREKEECNVVHVCRHEMKPFPSRVPQQQKKGQKGPVVARTSAALSRLCHGCLIHAAAVILRPGQNRLSMATATRSEQTVVRV